MLLSRAGEPNGNAVGRGWSAFHRPSHAQHRSTAACSQSPCASSAACLRTSSSIFRCFLCLWASAAPEHATHTKSTRSKQYATSEPSTMRAASRDCNPHQKESVGIRGHQRHSVGIRGHQRQSEAITWVEQLKLERRLERPSARTEEPRRVAHVRRDERTEGSARLGSRHVTTARTDLGPEIGWADARPIAEARRLEALCVHPRSKGRRRPLPTAEYTGGRFHLPV